MRRKEALDYLFGLESFGIRLGLARVKKVLRCLGNPEKQVAGIIHVAGTNGKGSVCSMLSGILQSAGYRTGTYTSPHLTCINERIRVNGECIGDRDLARYTGTIKKVIEGRKVKLTYFEFLTVLAFSYFAGEKLDAAVIETGMGGRLDATNVVEKPLVSIITNIGKDHTDYLGNDLESIAREKAGIIKQSGLVVTGEKKSGPLSVFRKKCSDKNAVLLCAGRDFRVTAVRRTEAFQEFDYKGSCGDYDGLRIKLMGIHQLDNAALALCAVEALDAKGSLKVPEPAVRKGLFAAQWQGRLQHVTAKRGGRSYDILLDGAHNLPGMKTLRDYLLEIRNRYEKIILVFGVLGDKDYRKMIHEIIPVASRIVTVAPSCERALPAEVLYGEMMKTKKSAGLYCSSSVSKGIETAMSISGKRDLICISGSLYTVGEAVEKLLAAKPGKGHR